MKFKRAVRKSGLLYLELNVVGEWNDYMWLVKAPTTETK